VIWLSVGLNVGLVALWVYTVRDMQREVEEADQWCDLKCQNREEIIQELHKHIAELEMRLYGAKQ
jgi:hypothetical protein